MQVQFCLCLLCALDNTETQIFFLCLKVEKKIEDLQSLLENKHAEAMQALKQKKAKNKQYTICQFKI